MLVAFCLLSLPMPNRASAAGEEIPLDLQMQIFLKIMTYNRSLVIEKLDAFVVTIVHGKPGKDSLDEQIARLRGTLGSKTILGRPIKINVVSLGKAFKADMVPASHLVVWFGRVVETSAPLLAWTQAQKILSATAAQDADPQEFVVLLRLEDEKPTIHFNLNLARQLGFDFHAQFLKHCVIVK